MFGSTPLEATLKRCLTPSVFFLGMVLGFAVCCVLGRHLPKLLPMREFQRLHTYLNPQSLYFPTALQIRALARKELPRDKIAVIISGNSIMMGSGQSVDQVWTKELQRELGEEYRLLNLAVPSGAPNEIGQAAFEMICADHRRVLHVCNCNPLAYASAVDGSSPSHRYFIHDARTRGLLLPDRERAQALDELASQRAAEPSFNEMLLQAWANRWLSFNDLWHVVGYETCFTVWTPMSDKQPWRARKYWPDHAGASRQRATWDWLKQQQDLQEHSSVYTTGDWDRFAAIVTQSVPKAVRASTLAVIVRRNPKYLARMELESPGLLAKYDRKIDEAIAALRSCGLAAQEVGAGIESPDFADSRHLFASGGAKLAEELAPAIRALSKRLSYAKGAQP